MHKSIIPKILLNLLLLLAFSAVQAQDILMTSNSLKALFENTTVESTTVESEKEKEKTDFKLPSLLETTSFYYDGQRPAATFLNALRIDGMGPDNLQIEGWRSVNYFRFMNQRAESVYSFDLNGVFQRSELSIQFKN